MGFVQLTHREDGVVMVVFDHPEKAVNTLSPALVAEVRESVLPLLEDSAVRAVVLASAKKDSFIAGADLEVLTEMQRPEQASALSSEGNHLLSAVATARKPVVAAVHGAALGGGLEVALACHYIVASDHPTTVLALPEVMLGLLPAGGGTQRLVARVGLIQALPLLLTGKRLRAKKALRLGLVDALTTPGGIADTAARAALALADGTLRRRRRKATLVDRLAVLPPVRAFILNKARQQVARQTRGLYPAPPAILDCVDTGLRRGAKAGLARESEHFGRLVVSEESRSLVWIFQALNRAKKAPEPAPERTLHRLAVLGAGFMGAGVASVSLADHEVVLRDVSADALGRAAREINGGLGKQCRSGALTRVEADRRWARLQLTGDDGALTGADVVIEAVFEDLELKRRVLAEVEDLVAEDVVFASNTSALPIADIAREARHPERVLGMHYFSPVPKMPLLEIVVGEQTAPWAVAVARTVGARQGKSSIVVKDGPGFYTTRILAPYLNEAVRLVEEGARIEEVDRALRDFGFPVGPLALIDEVGIDVGAHVAEHLGEAFAHRGLGASPALPTLHKTGFAGRKNGRGFYRYPAVKGKGRKQPNPEVYGVLGGAERVAVAASEIQARLAAMMINEAVHCLAEGVISGPSDGDLGAILGLGFPPMRGGPFHHLDRVGAATFVAELERLTGAYGERFRPAPLLVDTARGGARFHG